MNPYQVMGVIACCVSMFAGVVTFLTVQGMPLPLAFLTVYVTAVWFMIGMQRRARESYGCAERPRRRRREPSLRQPRRPLREPRIASVALHGVASRCGVVTLHEPAAVHEPGDPRGRTSRRDVFEA